MCQKVQCWKSSAHLPKLSMESFPSITYSRCCCSWNVVISKFAISRNAKSLSTIGRKTTWKMLRKTTLRQSLEWKRASSLSITITKRKRLVTSTRHWDYKNNSCRSGLRSLPRTSWPRRHGPSIGPSIGILKITAVSGRYMI